MPHPLNEPNDESRNAAPESARRQRAVRQLRKVVERALEELARFTGVNVQLAGCMEKQSTPETFADVLERSTRPARRRAPS